jgi:hypothetical protein
LETRQHTTSFGKAKNRVTSFRKVRNRATSFVPSFGKVGNKARHTHKQR